MASKTTSIVPQVDARALERQIEIAQRNVDVQRRALAQIRARVEEARHDPAHPNSYSYACQSYAKQYEGVCRAEEALSRLQDQADENTYMAKRSRELTRELSKEYEGRGPQYAVLVRRLVYAELNAERLERSGRALKTTEMVQVNKAVLDAVQALQKYTESQKSEVLQTARQEGMLVIMEIAERVIAPKAPELWAKVVDLVDEQRDLLPAGRD